MWHVNGDVVMWDLIVTIMWAVKVVVGFKYYGMDFPYLFTNTKDGGSQQMGLTFHFFTFHFSSYFYC